MALRFSFTSARLLGERDLDLGEARFETAKAALDLANVAFHAIELPTHMTEMLEDKIFNLDHYIFFRMALFLLSERVEAAPQAAAKPRQFRAPETGQFRRLRRFRAGFDLCRLPRRWPALPLANLPL